jgi:hypothetical protein
MSTTYRLGDLSNKPKLSKKDQALADKAAAIESIKQIIAGDPKPVIYTIARRTSSGGYGISQDIALVYLKEGTPWNLTYYAGQILGLKVKNCDGYNAINNTGGNMDLGFDLVYSLSCYLFTGQDRAGYVLSHRWL